MSELKMVLKVFLFSALLVMLSQIRMGGDTLENKTSRWLMHSSTARYLQGVAAGAVKAGKTLFISSKKTISNTMQDFQSESSEYFDDSENSFEQDQSRSRSNTNNRSSY